MSERCRPLAPHLLRRHVAHRAHDRARLGACCRRLSAGAGRAVGQLGQAEVEDLHEAVAGEEDVLRLEIAVDDPLLVSGGEPGAICREMRSVSSGVSGPVRSFSRSVVPRRSSVTMKGRPCSSPTSNTATMLGCCTDPAARASRANDAQRGVGRSRAEQLHRDVAVELAIVRAQIGPRPRCRGPRPRGRSVGLTALGRGPSVRARPHGAGLALRDAGTRQETAELAERVSVEFRLIHGRSCRRQPIPAASSGGSARAPCPSRARPR